MLRTGMKQEVPGILEATFSSRLKGLPSFKAIEKDPSAEMCRTDSCRFGSIHMKPFRFLSVHTSLKGLARRCKCKCKHVKVEGKFTKASATYTTELSRELARTIGNAMEARRRLLAVEECPLAAGLENLFVNEVVQTEDWEPFFSWGFKKAGHVNITWRRLQITEEWSRSRTRPWSEDLCLKAELRPEAWQPSCERYVRYWWQQVSI